MKKLIIAILAAILASGAFAQQSFPDIPEGHWAGDAVDRIADLNIVIGFPDGTFRGNEAFTRYQAALVVSRLLDVVSEDMDAALAMTDEDIASLRNAVQELSSDVAAQGTRLSAAEGSIAGLSDDVTSQGARLDEIEAALGDTEVDPAVLQDLQNQIASQRVAIDTAQATADEALSRANAAGSQSAANAEEIAALNQLIQLLGDDVEALQGAGDGDVAGLEARVARNEGDIANIREFVILLRRDQVALRDRVSALEDSDAQQTADIADLQDRVTQIERNPLGLAGSIGIDFRNVRFAGDTEAFDVDRAYGVDLPRTMWWDEESFAGSVFSDTEDVEDADDAVAQADLEPEPGSFAADPELSFGSELTGVGAVDEFQVTLDISLESLSDVIDGEEDAGLEIDADTFVLSIDGLTAQFGLADESSLSFVVGSDIAVEFSPYTLNVSDQSGLVATYQGGETLAFLDPTVQVAFLTGDVDDELFAGFADDDAYSIFGARATVSPLDGLDVGVSYATNTAGDADAISDDVASDTIFGADLAASLGPVDLAAEYSSASIDGDDADTALFVTADAEFDVLNGVEFSANYRDIDPAFGETREDDDDDEFSGLFGSGVQLTDADAYEFDADQSGFFAGLGVQLFIVDLDVFFDSYSTADPDAETTAFGVEAAAPLFAGFGVTAFYEQVSIGDDVVADNDATERDNAYRTGFGVGIAHDGEAENALVDGLDLGFEFRQVGADYDITELEADAGYDLDVSIVELSPYVEFLSHTAPEDVDADWTTIRVGTGLATEPLDIFLAPSLEAAVNYRTTGYSDFGSADEFEIGDADEFTATEFQWSVGLALNEFLLEESVFTARVGSYTGTNTDWDTVGSMGGSDEDVAPDAGADDSVESVSGYELAWDYRGLELTYGGYARDRAVGEDSYAQVFGVAYSIELE